MDIVRPSPDQPIPPDAQLMFKGIIFDVYQWQQKMFDGSYATFEKIKRLDSIKAIPVLQNGNILCMEEHQPGFASKFVGVPGGRVERKDDALGTAKRELLEEAGLEATEWSLWHAAQPIGFMDWALFVFIAKKARKVREPVPDPGGEKITLRELSFEEFSDFTQDPAFDNRFIKEQFKRGRNEPAAMAEIKKAFYS